ncbi:hypothetical protein SARC_04212 [Sphaeroforma arctica JP610]|uniref:Helicase ATP-binding domain-containing protein n=1 Tax=Sphaeroforma arctica JP610 TaxID=667725 RepID=A0A0L0G3V6_9EUKA|nr:hypothetical protein SARC_04212 [Sphaeroforma arctica JP610]KNC83539.1 hypothetical protein SARC_04212 [Sphaeroforma arctica JP610]|eukprot:XP_014157441.1 hypothetical protein SARC_04212 [Sphaeroforma arctica JP610]
MENFDRPKRTTHACARVSLSKKTKIDEDSPDASRVPENSLEVDSQLICDQTDFNIIVIENKSTDESSGKGHGVPQSTARTQSRQQADQLHEGLVGSRSIRHTDASQQRDGGMPQSARKKGRPKGAKNKEKGRALKDATSIEVGTGMGVEDRDIDTSTCLPPVAVAGKGSASKRGRPKGTKNKNSKRGQTISTNTSTSKDTRVQHSTHASMATDEGTTVTVQRELPECMKRLAVLYQSIDLGCAFLRIGGRVLSFKNVMAVAAANCGITPTHVDLARLCAIAPKLIKVYHNAYELEDIFKLEAMKEPYRLDTRTEGQKRADETAALASEGFFREKGAAADDQGTSLPPPSVVRKSDSIIEMIGKGSKGRKMPTPRMLTDRRIAFELRVQLWLAKFGTLDDTATVYEEALFATVNYEHFESEPSTRSTTPPDCSREALDRNIFGDGDGETSAEFLAHLKSLPFYHGQIAHVEHIPARAAKFSETDIDEDPNIGWSVADAVKCVSKIERLYTHQAHAIAHSSAGNHVVLCTSTSSGKSLAYNIPVLQAIVDDPTTMALYLFPTKALAQDQQRALKKLTAHDTLCNRVKVATFDGDTDRETRSVVRESANIILSNPDMIHASILPYHDQWSHFLSRLK